jgi:uncharacterized protein YPO0396
MTAGQGHEQFRLTRMQLFNWGTFAGLIDLTIPADGYLVVGPSGSGKSTLLDAHAALFTPPKWLAFNAAARENERQHRDRSLLTYIRGAWANQTGEAGEHAVQYLRSGTTWSAVAETYANAMGATVTLAQVLWVKGQSTAPKDARRLFLILERPFELGELRFFAAHDFDVRRIKAELPDAFVRPEFVAYQERMSRLLGIENERALRLLHKTQSAKNLGDLNVFMREFMLDEPETFAIAERLVNEFVELNEAHQSVVRARKQIATLRPARDAFASHAEEGNKLAQFEALQNTLSHHREHHRRRLLLSHVDELVVSLEGARQESSRRAELAAHERDKLTELEKRRLGLGAEVSDQLKRDLAATEGERPDRVRKRALASQACETLGWNLADSPSSFVAQIDQAKSRVVAAAVAEETYEAARDELQRKREISRSDLETALIEVRALERQRSNLPAFLIALREAMAQELRIPQEELPFAGELLEVRPDQRAWQGAIERVLGGLARSLVIDEKRYAAVAGFLNSRHIGGRLAYLRMVPHDRPRRTAGSRSLVHKLTPAPGEHGDWIRAELLAHFDFACVESLADLRAEERAVTRQGQVKRSQKLHEKDDATAIDDPSRWVIGFDNREKLALYQARAAGLADALSTIEGELARLRDERKRDQAALLQCQTLANLTWKEVDVASLVKQIGELQTRLDAELAGNTKLAQLEVQIKAQEHACERATGRHTDAESQAKSIQALLKGEQGRLEKLEKASPDAITPPANLALLDAMLDGGVASLTLENIDSRTAGIERSLAADIRKSEKARYELRAKIEGSLAAFNREWPADAGGLDAVLASAGDYLGKLARLEADDLPRFEERFFRLLHEQSDQNLTLLATKLDQERTDIKARMELVNESLRDAPFDKGTRLVIETRDRQLEAVTQFRADLKSALSRTLSDDPQAAEERFSRLAALVKRLGSQESGDKTWRELVLDVRQHVEFVAIEHDADGKEVEVYRSGAGKSGGQRQKLAATCLAAALRYQLGGVDRALPMFSTVALDEAFDKADAEFTAMAMNIFATFGFQMIVATPLKSVMTLEPFIGGACFVHIKDRKASGLVTIAYDPGAKKLAWPAKVSDATPVP